MGRKIIKLEWWLWFFLARSQVNFFDGNFIASMDVFFFFFDNFECTCFSWSWKYILFIIILKKYFYFYFDFLLFFWKNIYFDLVLPKWHIWRNSIWLFLLVAILQYPQQNLRNMGCENFIIVFLNNEFKIIYPATKFSPSKWILWNSL